MWVWIEQVGPSGLVILAAMLLPFALAIGGFVHGVKNGSIGGYILGAVTTIAIVVTIVSGIMPNIERKNNRATVENPDFYLVEIQGKENVSNNEFQFSCKITNTSDYKLEKYTIELVATNWNGDVLLRTTIPSSACEAHSSDEFSLLVTVKGNTASQLYDTDFEYLNISVIFKYLRNEHGDKSMDHTRVLQTADLEKLENAYQEAVAAYNSGQYAQAMELFSHLGSYKESYTYIQNAYEAQKAA